MELVDAVASGRRIGAASLPPAGRPRIGQGAQMPCATLVMLRKPGTAVACEARPRHTGGTMNVVRFERDGDVMGGGSSKTVVHRIYRDADRPSHLLLPVIPL